MAVGPWSLSPLGSLFLWQEVGNRKKFKFWVSGKHEALGQALYDDLCAPLTALLDSFCHSMVVQGNLWDILPPRAPEGEGMHAFPISRSFVMYRMTSRTHSERVRTRIFLRDQLSISLYGCSSLLFFHLSGSVKIVNFNSNLHSYVLFLFSLYIVL